MDKELKLGENAVLILEDGKTFFGSPIGKIGTTSGEICFNTGMSGYQEIFTDPSYFGQIIVSTSNHIGNYGAYNQDLESDSVKIAGLICKTYSDNYSRTIANSSLDEWFIGNNLTGISDIDTRQVVRHIRDKGAMNCIISSEILDIEELKNQLSRTPIMEGLELASKVSTKNAYNFSNQNGHKIAIIDYGMKKSIAQCFADRGCAVKVFPHNSSFSDIMSWEPDGIMLSNGPGDPAPLTSEIKVIQNFFEAKIPIFGICLGHQLLSRALGLETFKMHNGHRGLNHPVKNLITNHSEITSQNHGFAVKVDFDNPLVDITHVNLNDNTVEGIKVKGHKAFSVQYHPEASPGPHDSRYLFDQFLNQL